VPLLDHFHPPLSSERHWESFHARWAAAIADALEGGLLPPGYFSEVQVHVGPRIEADVATFNRNGSGSTAGSPGGGQTAVVTTTASWTVPQPALRLPAAFPDEFEVQVIDSNEGGPILVAAIELVSPRNKDRPEARRVFASKCVSYLSQGIGVCVVDIVTNRQANMHNEMVALMGLGPEFLLPAETSLYTVAYRPTLRQESEEIDAWPHPLVLGGSLPVTPLALRNAAVLPLDLEASYADVCRRSRMP
jgi:hypothetical protein